MFGISTHTKQSPKHTFPPTLLTTAICNKQVTGWGTPNAWEVSRYRSSCQHPPPHTHTHTHTHLTQRRYYTIYVITCTYQCNSYCVQGSSICLAYGKIRYFGSHNGYLNQPAITFTWLIKTHTTQTHPHGHTHSTPSIPFTHTHTHTTHTHTHYIITFTTSTYGALIPQQQITVGNIKTQQAWHSFRKASHGGVLGLMHHGLKYL